MGLRYAVRSKYLWKSLGAQKVTFCLRPRRSNAGFVHHLSMILQMHCAVQDHLAPEVGARDWLALFIVGEMLMIEVLLKVAATRESLQAINGR